MGLAQQDPDDFQLEEQPIAEVIRIRPYPSELNWFIDIETLFCTSALLGYDFICDGDSQTITKVTNAK